VNKLQSCSWIKRRPSRSSWPVVGEYNTKRFTNWPYKDNPYAKLTPNDPPGEILVLTEVKPK